MKISDELRERASDCIDKTGPYAKFLQAIADRIDAEMVELPKDMDGAPIHVGDTVWFVERDDVELKVDHITFFKDKTKVDAMSDRHVAYSNPTDYTHERPDSWECIADELDEQAGSLTKDGYTWQEDAIHDFADRIRKLAKRKEGK